MKFFGDYHLHTFASDGRSSISDYARLAKQRGLKQIAVTDHSFASFMFHMTDGKFAKQEKIIADLGDLGVKIFHGVEANMIGANIDVPASVVRRCDILTVGFHRFITPCRMNGQSRFLLVNGFGSSAKKEKLILSNTEAYISIMENYPVDVLAHLGHRAPVDIARVCECAAKHKVYIELNEKHIGALAHGIEDVISSGASFIVGTDSHEKNKMGRFEDVRGFIKKYGIPTERVFGIDGNEPVFKDKREWKYGSDV